MDGYVLLEHSRINFYVSKNWNKTNIIKVKLDTYFRYVKYILLAIICCFSFIEISVANIFYNIEPFKTAITLRFMAPASAVIWASFLLVICLFIERFL